MPELLTSDFKKYADDLKELLKHVENPRLIFDFPQFKCLFAREIIPSQVLEDRKLVFFDPSNVMIFGLNLLY